MTSRPLPASLACPTFTHIDLVLCEDRTSLMVYAEGKGGLEIVELIQGDTIPLLGEAGKRALAPGGPNR